jgi:hypothetical protein
VSTERRSAEDPGKDPGGFVDLLCRDIQMGDGAEAAASDRVDEHAVVLELGHEISRGQAMVGDIEDHNVGLDMLRRDAHGRDLLKRPRQFLGMVMIMPEAGDMVFERP